MAEEEPPVDVGDEEEEPPPPELTPEEKIAALKEALVQGEMGPAQFDKEWQTIWMAIKAEEGLGAHGDARANRRNTHNSNDD